MKALFKFVSDEKTYEISQQIMSDFDNLYQNLDQVVTFAGKIWECQCYFNASGIFDVEVHYSIQKHRPHMASPVPTKHVGPLHPHAIDCTCGTKHTFMSNVLDYHSTWCDLRNKDGWDDAIREYLDTWKEFDRLVMEDSQIIP